MCDVDCFCCSMRHFILIQLLLIIGGLNKIVAQPATNTIDECQFVVAYDYICNTFDNKGNCVSDTIKLALQVGNKMTKCTEYYRTMLQDFKEWQNREYQEGEWAARQYNVPTWYVNFPEGKTRTLDQIIPTRYLVEGSVPKIDWKLETDTMTIENHLCHKATGLCYERIWEAWYAEDVPTPVGPWKLRGLPGLIMKATDKDGIHSFVFCGLLNKKTPMHWMDDARYIKIAEEKFIKQRNKIFCNKKYTDNPRYYIPDGALSDAVEMWAGGPEPPAQEKYTTIAIDMIVPKVVNVYQPLELK